MIDILLAEDNVELAELIKTFLVKAGYQVFYVTSGEEALEYLKQESVKLLLLDIMLPGMDGFAVCRAVRKHGNIPIIIISAKSQKIDKLNGFELGADDYLDKPVDSEILLAKVKALLQRTYGMALETDVVLSGDITIDKNARKVFLKEQELELNVKEYELLLLFVQNQGKTLHKEYLFNQIWGIDSFSENQTLTVHINMLRTKIEENVKSPKRLQTVWGVGYRYEEI